MGHTESMQRTSAELEGLIDGILAAPKDGGPIEMIVRRPAENEREVVESAELTFDSGLVGDDWVNRVDQNGEPHRAAQLTLMNARVADAVAVTRERWPLAGDQVYVDMDLSVANLPPGTKVRLGEAVVEISVIPHTGCAKFAGRFGKDALRFANVGPGRENRFRGVNAIVVEGGTFSLGDVVTKL
jgi:MOSC domain-containing protein YiiM